MQRHLCARQMVPLTQSVIPRFSENWQGWLRRARSICWSLSTVSWWTGSHRTARFLKGRWVTGKALLNQPHHLNSIAPMGEIIWNCMGAEGLGPLLSNQGKAKPFQSSPKPMHFLNIWYLCTQRNSISPFLCTFFFKENWDSYYSRSQK